MQRDDLLAWAMGAAAAQALVNEPLDPLPRSYGQDFLRALLDKDTEDFQRILRIPRCLFDNILLHIRLKVEHRRFLVHAVRCCPAEFPQKRRAVLQAG